MNVAKEFLPMMGFEPKILNVGCNRTTHITVEWAVVQRRLWRKKSKKSSINRNVNVVKNVDVVSVVTLSEKVVDVSLLHLPYCLFNIWWLTFDSLIRKGINFWCNSVRFELCCSKIFLFVSDLVLVNECEFRLYRRMFKMLKNPGSGGTSGRSNGILSRQDRLESQNRLRLFQFRIVLTGCWTFLIMCNRTVHAPPSTFLSPITFYHCKIDQLQSHNVPRKRINWILTEARKGPH